LRRSRSLDSNVATAAITVRRVNHAPVAGDGSSTTDQVTAKAVTLRATDPDGDPLTHSRAGSVVARPARMRVGHGFRGGGGMKLLAYGTREPNDIAWYPRSKKV
jgi:hypothetical protein